MKRVIRRDSLSASLLLGLAMVARGEIGLLIIRIGYNETDYVSEDAFVTGIWAILLNTILGPVLVGFLVKSRSKQIGGGPWGLESNRMIDDRHLSGETLRIEFSL